MRFARPALMLVTIVALAAYGFDCGVTSTPDEAMQCCDTMPSCSHNHEHSEDCCRTMPSVHPPFVQAGSAQGVMVSLVEFAILRAINNSTGIDFSTHAIVTAHSHAPPIPQPAVISPLRI